MPRRSRKVAAGFLFAHTIIFASFHVFANNQAAAFGEERTIDVVRESVRLLIDGENPTKEQRLRIQDMSERVMRGEIGRKEIYRIVKKQVYMDMETQKITRYQIGNMLKRAPGLLPTLTGEDLHKIIWEKIKGMLKEPLHLKIGSLAPEGTAYVEVPRKKIIPHMAKVSDGKIIFKLYVGGVMGEDVDILRKMDMGQMHCCGCSSLGVLKAAPEVALFSLPLLFRDYEEVDHILKKFRKEIDAAFEKRGYTLATLIDSGFFYLWSKNRVLTLDEIRRQKVATWSGEVEVATLEELGIKPTTISAPEISTSLNTGLVDTIIGPPPWILGTQAYNNLNYYVTQPLFYAPGAVIFSNKIRSRFQGRNSEMLIENFIEMFIYETQTVERWWIEDQLRPYERKCIEAFRKRGMKPVTLSQKDMAAIKAASKRVWFKLADDVYSKDFLNKILKELRAYRN
jgi:TRAP-type C4-dicarboxylate transport system substrate-binding protein